MACYISLYMSSDGNDLFNKLKQNLLNIDPVYFVEKYLTLDGKPFRLTGNGYKPLSDIYRYIGIKALEPTAKPVIITKARQVGLSTAASALEMYFMGSGIFGVDGKPPIRIIHAFPQLELAAAFAKTKLNQMISSSVPLPTDPNNKAAKVKSYMQSLLDQSSATNDSLHFKQFINGNHLWVESIGVDGNRVMGRQLCLDTDIPTPTGFIKLKDLEENQELFDENGYICKVTKLHPINISPKSYRITFDDNTVIDACADHLWLTYTKENRSKKTAPKVKSTKDLINTLNVGKEKNHSIPCTGAVQYPHKDLALDPYIFGLWLGDGNRKGHIESADPEIVSEFSYKIIPSSIRDDSKSQAYKIDGLITKLTEVGVLKNHAFSSDKKGWYNKFIPTDYLTSSFEQRLALLQGLMDSDGHCDKNGNCEFVQIRKELAEQVFDLVLSLGIKAYFYINENYRYRIRFKTILPVFKLQRKLDRLPKINSNRISHRYISSIESIEPRPMRCITVDSKSSLFLITKKYIPTHNTADVIFYDEVQSTTGAAIGNSLKTLTTAKYGKVSKGVQIYFGTPRKKGSDFYKMWQASSQQYYYLGCEHCHDYFPLYTPGSDAWKKVWIYGFVVKCPHCGTEQNKLEAAERGKWVAFKDPNDPDCQMVGFHINQLYMPMFTREDIDNESPGKHPINTERVFMNEVLGEFFQGDSSPITHEEIKEFCSDDRKFAGRIPPTSNENQLVVLGIDYGARSDLEQMANPDKIKGKGQSYSTAVVLSAKGPGLLHIEFACKFKRNDPESKKGIIDQIMRQYSVNLAIGDIGFSNDFSVILHQIYGDKYLVSRAHSKVNNHIKYTTDSFPKELVFERDYYIGELFEQLKKGMIKFPYGDYEKIAWLVDHCCSMEIKPTVSRTGGDPQIHYVKGGGPNDGFMALLNAYIAYKFIITKGFTNNNPLLQQTNFKDLNKPLVTGGYFSRKF